MLVKMGVWLCGVTGASSLLVLFALVYCVWRYQTAKRMKGDPDFANHRLAARYFTRAKAERRRGRRVSAQAYYEMACDLDPTLRDRSLEG
jgi:hypothetical protein